MAKNRKKSYKKTIKIGISTISMLSVSRSANATLYNHFEFIDFYGNIDINGEVDWDASLNGTAPRETITGTIGFDETLLDSTRSGINIPAQTFTIDSVPSYFKSIWQNTNFEIGKNLVGAGNFASSNYKRTYQYFNGATTGNAYTSSNSFDIINGVISDFNFEERYYLDLQEPNNADNEQYEWIVLGGAENENSLLDPAYAAFNGLFPGNFLEIAYLLDSPLLTSGSVTYSDVFVYDFDNNITFTNTSVSESSPILGLLTIGGIWGIFRFRERINDKSSNTN